MQSVRGGRTFYPEGGHCTLVQNVRGGGGGGGHSAGGGGGGGGDISQGGGGGGGDNPSSHTGTVGPD